MRIALAIISFAAGACAIAATCVTSTGQRGPAGPFIAEVVNTGDQTIHGALAYSRIYDADGREVLIGNIGALACPSKLLPGEHGVVEVFADDPQFTEQFPRAEWKLPLRAEFFRTEFPPAGTGQARGDGLWVEEVSRNDAAGTIAVRVHNNADEHYQQFSICGILRSSAGEALEVARADSPSLPFTLFPGESYDMELVFHSFPDGDVTYHALGLFNEAYPPCCPVNGDSAWRSTDTGPFSVLLPPGWAYEQDAGIDSFVGHFAGDGMSVAFDYGAYSNPLPYDGDPAYDVRRETIGGYSAKVVRSRTDGAGESGVFFADLKPEATAPQQFPLRLTLTASGLSAAQRATLTQIIRSIRFDVRVDAPAP